jgi:hypothetical protein
VAGIDDAPSNSEEKKPYLVRFESAVRIVRASDPSLTTDDVIWELWDALNNQRLTAELPKSTIKGIHLLGSNKAGRPIIGLELRDEVEGIRAGYYDKEELLQLWPPLEPTGQLQAVSPNLRTSGRPSLPIAALTTEMRRRAAAGDLDQNWSKTSRQLSAWAKANHPDTPHSVAGIRGNKILSAEHSRLTVRSHE